MLDTLTGLSWPYLLALAALSVQWLLTVWREARLGRGPWLAWLAVPGLSALIAAPLIRGGEPLFGLGAALLLIAVYAGGAYRTAGQRWGERRSVARSRAALLALCFVGGVFSALVPAGWVPAGGLAPLGWLAALWAGGVLAALAALLGASGQPPRPQAAPTLALRFGAYLAPPWPDLELRVEGDRAWIQNIGPGNVQVAGWSFSDQNAWMRARDKQGKPLHLLAKGSRAVLSPWPAGTLGVRVWYVRQTDPAVSLVFRADWQPLDHPQRVLN
ncbi:hypothetical protein [Deinococcus sp.]|uniref:hypothetical protein n=1 Tax=Deinococcus sp. TaxID=47478 RepID=UPI003CC53056